MSRKGVCSFKIVFAAPENTTLSPHFTKPSLVCQAVGLPENKIHVASPLTGLRKELLLNRKKAAQTGIFNTTK